LGTTLTGSPADVTFSPVPAYTGADSFQFTVTDSGGGALPPLTTPPATVNIIITPDAAPALFAPAGTTTNTQPTISWTAQDGAATYDLWVDNLSTGTSQVIRQQT